MSDLDFQGAGAVTVYTWSCTGAPAGIRHAAAVTDGGCPSAEVDAIVAWRDANWKVCTICGAPLVRTVEKSGASS